MGNVWNLFAVQICRVFHGEVMQPVKGHYVCRTCRRAYPVPWEEGQEYLRRVRVGSQSANRNRSFEVFQLLRNRG
jgi:hypothetical protein